MASINKVFILGNLGAAPEIKYTKDNRAIANLSIATSRRYKHPQTGEVVSEVEWHRVVVFNRTAEVAKDYLHKGSSVLIEGRLRTRKWQDQNGQDRFTTEIVCDQMHLLGSKDQNRSGASDNFESNPRKAPPPQSSTYDDEDVPF